MYYEVYATNMCDTPVPDFGPAGADLEGWDEAMEMWDPDTKVLATFHADEDYWESAETDVNLIVLQTVEYYSQKFAKTGWEVDYRRVTPTKQDPFELKDFWTEYGELWCADIGPDTLGSLDNAGQLYDFYNDKRLHEQVPDYDDYLMVIAYVSSSDAIWDCNNTLDCDVDTKRSNLAGVLRDLWSLHDRLYGVHNYDHRSNFDIVFERTK